MSKRRNFPKKHDRVNEDDKELLVFGYESRLYPTEENLSEYYSSEQHLIPWHGDDNLKIDRYDVRLYLHDLSEFDEKRRVVLEELCPTEQMEEEMCEEERYRDLFEDMKRVEKAADEERRTREKGVAIGFSYEDSSVPKAESSSSEEEIDEPYEVPVGLKLPVGLELPKSLKQSTIIDKTALFVVKQGPQMEIVIKAKQRRNIEQFGFLDFDHILNPYYKYICKLIREQKYTPTFKPLQRRPKAKKLRRLADEKAHQENGAQKKPKNALEAIASLHGTDSEEISNDEDEGSYLHPLLLSGSKIKTEDKLTEATIGPMPKPPKEKTPEPDLLSMIKKDYDLGKSNDIYSSLFKNLSDFLPRKEEPREELSQPKEETVIQESVPTTSRAIETDFLETNEEVIKAYNEWHKSFYGKDSPFYPGPPPVVIPPPPSYLVHIQAAATYVAQHGPSAENTLIDHNGEIEFMVSTSRYFTFYHAQIRFHQWQSQKHGYNQSVEKRNDTAILGYGETIETEGKKRERRRFADNHTKVELEEPKIIDPTTRNDSTVENVSSILKEIDFPRPPSEPKLSEMDIMQHERKERARKFMERILKEKISSKNKGATVRSKPSEVDVWDKSDDEDDHREVEPATLFRENRNVIFEKATICKELKPEAISSIISKTIEKALPELTSMVSTSKNVDKSERKDRNDKHRSKKHRDRRHSSSDSSYEERRREKKRRRRSSRSRSRSRGKRTRSRSSSRSSQSPSYRSSRRSRKRSASRSRR